MAQLLQGLRQIPAGNPEMTALHTINATIDCVSRKYAVRIDADIAAASELSADRCSENDWLRVAAGPTTSRRRWN
jgi:hypothetical protein